MTIPEGPYADTRDMYAVHTAFRREFAALPALVRGVEAGDDERLRVVADHIELVSAVLEAHHRSEDVHLWPKLLERGSEAVAPVVELMEGHHSRIERLNSEAMAALGEWRDRATVGRTEALADLLSRLCEVLYEHMSLEETHILPIAEKCVTAAEWQEMAGGSGARLPAESMPLVFGMVLYEGDQDVIEHILSGLPPAVRTMLEKQGTRDFAAHSQRVHGTPTPRRSGPLSSTQR
ncbi:hemerythrin domain-containing protein [Micromonospora sp. NBC_01796]|uniref:hemerythrin domain-containing protein n=1 Tax=Micromonospora sp. NBC_01796 TaxID=2975987 RepID=UPI002DD8F76D|nr:hemerythrin domain-containing protein [Micromonospora sp. NBC_01796]WSA85221.1 hemerythrin domain-containing protein [Micromonospora sp. NBC_01796]